VRLAALTQEVASLRAQHTYMESKLRSVEAVAESAGRAADELRKRNDQLQGENVRFKAENQQLKAENEQLMQFKNILLSTANNLQQPSLHSGLLSSTLRPQQFGVPDPMLSPQRSSLSTHDLDYKPSSSSAANGQATQQAATNSINNPSFFFSPLKRPQPQESISITHHHAPTSNQQPSASNAPQSTPSAQRSYAHITPSPLAPDALMSPPAAAQQQQQQTSKSTDDILQQINANLSASGRNLPAHSPLRSNPHSASSASYSASASSSSNTASTNLVEQARHLFHLAQSRLHPSAFSEFVHLVQQFRTVGGEQHAWEEIRLKAAMLLRGQHEVLALFDKLLEATQMQQRH
jgi:hypothetical protein